MIVSLITPGDQILTGIESKDGKENVKQSETMSHNQTLERSREVSSGKKTVKNCNMSQDFVYVSFNSKIALLIFPHISRR